MDLRIYVDAARTKLYQPVPHQIAFHRDPARFRALCGGVGSGKTISGAVEALKAALTYPGSRGLIGRYTEGELRRTSWHEFMQILPRELIAYENRAELIVRLWNKTEILGMHLENDFKLRSLNLDWGWVDEAVEVKAMVVRQLQMRLRGTVGPRQLWLTSNPDSKSSWLYRDFVQKRMRGHRYHHARTADATFLPPDYEASLRDVFDDEMAERFLEGSWDSLRGLVYSEFSRELHVLPWEPEQIPREWPRYRAMDHGWNDPTVCLFAASDPDGSIYIYDCFYRRHRTVPHVCEEVNAMSKGTHFDWTVMDPSTTRTESGGRTIASEYREAGLPVIMAARQKISVGIARMRKLLQMQQSLTHPVTQKPGGAGLYVLRHCLPLIAEFTNYKYPDDGSGESSSENPVDKNNHALDALRYLVMHNPQAASEQPAEQDWEGYFAQLRRKCGRREPEADVIGNSRPFYAVH